MNIKVIVATHKKYEMPEDQIYLPVQVGKAINSSLEYIGDDTGENISHKNPNYCELTAMYWAWKNIDADYLGLVHYRRHFGSKSFFIGSEKKKNILTRDKAQELLKEYDAIFPKKRNYWIETNKSQYTNAHYGKDLELTRDIINEKYPEYVNAFDKIMDKRSGHRFNMFVMKKELFDAYCEWLFDILFELERNIDITNYCKYQARVFGFISERLLDVWLEVNNVNYTEIPVIHMEKQNWPKKIFQFIKRKFTINQLEM